MAEAEEKEKEMTFWDHLDELRKIIMRVVIVVLVVMIAGFSLKEPLFEMILAPAHSDFILYRGFCQLATAVNMPGLCPDDFQVELINTQLASQFMTHMAVSFYIAILVAFPYILYQLFRFVAPALRSEERRYSFRMIFFACVAFFSGVVLNYFVIFPLSFRFLGTYQVSPEIPNTINLASYINTMLLLSLLMGVMAELPIISWLFAKLGVLNDTFMRKHRKHAIVIILIIAAVITPTGDAITLLLVFTPIYILYELSIVLVRGVARKRAARLEAAASE